MGLPGVERQDAELAGIEAIAGVERPPAGYCLTRGGIEADDVDERTGAANLDVAAASVGGVIAEQAVVAAQATDEIVAAPAF